MGKTFNKTTALKLFMQLLSKWLGKPCLSLQTRGRVGYEDKNSYDTKIVYKLIAII
jgi:hypothetical protein